MTSEHGYAAYTSVFFSPMTGSAASLGSGGVLAMASETAPCGLGLFRGTSEIFGLQKYHCTMLSGWLSFDLNSLSFIRLFSSLDLLETIPLASFLT